MAIRRSVNFVSQMRVDVPHMRSIESAVRNDFDELLQAYVLGSDESYILRGLEINMIGAIGTGANGLQLIVNNSAVFHGKSDISGTFFVIPVGIPNEILNSNVNPKIDGSFVPASDNYVGLEFTREVDENTISQVYMWSPGNKTEITKTIPLAETMGYKIVITSTDFAPNILPIAIVETSSDNNVLSITDRRPMLFRLGTAGNASPNPYYKYPWNLHNEERVENFWRSSSQVSPFRGGDKQIRTEKEWKDAVMSSILEVKGTPFWYSKQTTGSVANLRADVANTVTTGAGTISHSGNTAGKINWCEDIFLNLIGSRITYKLEKNEDSYNIVLLDNQVAYINLVRSVNILPNLIFTNNTTGVHSVGSVPWTMDLEEGDYIKLSTSDDSLYYKIATISSDHSIQLVEPYPSANTGSGGAQAKYAFGTYKNAPSATSNRHIHIANKKDVPLSEEAYWLFFRSDSQGLLPKIFVRFTGMELELGEKKQINDNQTLNILKYVGSPSESTTIPSYANIPNERLPNHFTTESLTYSTSQNTGNINHLVNAMWRPYVERMIIDVDKNIGDLLTLPVDSVDGLVKYYLVGREHLQVDLNGQILNRGIDWAPVVSITDANSNELGNEIEILQTLVNDDIVGFRMEFPNIFDLTMPPQPFFRRYITNESGQLISTIAPYNKDIHTLSVYRNGIRLINSNTIGESIERYQEVSDSAIMLEVGALPSTTDIFTFVNHEVAPEYYDIRTGLISDLIEDVPLYTMFSNRLKVYRNGILMDRIGTGLNSYEEESPTSIRLDVSATPSDIFLFVNSNSSPDFREDIINETGTVVTLGDGYTVGNQKLKVYRNGILLINSDDSTLGEPINRYTETSANEITLEVPLVEEDTIVVIYK